MSKNSGYVEQMQKFSTNFQYKDRKAKAKYVWLKYQSILSGHILDVGADECHLKGYLPEGTTYWGIGLGGNPDQQVNLEDGRIPFPDNSYDCVLCLDVLEHIENPHQIFDELCRVSRRYVIVSLPNSWHSLMIAVLSGAYSDKRHLKYYGLPPEKPTDRHKWFLSYIEASLFVEERAMQNNMRVLQIDDYSNLDRPHIKHRLFARCIRFGLRLAKLDPDIFLAGTMWAVLEIQNE